MRKVSETIAKAFLNGKAARAGNTETDGRNVWLHGNLIARKGMGQFGDTIELTLAGWNTVTTRERLNTICDLATNRRPFSQRNFEPMFNDAEISANEWISVSRF